ncbi:LutC/YkgG family protein [Pedobacter caeni]|uniref:L-lactate dehydrogenase complex protein LldG n=1 Tax=Pedobacter caeni TaxID=288992 RepID=A0A1M5BQP1_9SPHI|nr:LUD domain-containing protein [Pedobacter caeni]SHF44745.1 L-lactate dehydrogenase complex protein LldG [Pedobacter caeni]
MNSRAQILSRIKENQPELSSLPADLTAPLQYPDPVEVFSTVLSNIGGTTVPVKSYEEIQQYIKTQFADQKRIISTIPELSAVTEAGWEGQDPHSYEDIDIAVIRAHFGVAENAALWVTEELMQQRVIPFICQQLAVVVQRKDICSNMHEAYAKVADAVYGFGTFIAGPSKTADIEQSLVLGAHGPKNMTVFILEMAKD